MAELTDVVADVVEEVGEHTLDAAVMIRNLTRVKISFAAIGAAAGAVVSTIISFKIAYSRAEKKYEEIAQQEINQVKQHYLTKLDATMERVTKPELEDVVVNLGYTTEEQDAIEEVVEEESMEQEAEEVRVNSVVRNIFEQAKEDVWDYATEVKTRDPNVPYVIHVDEYGANEKNHEQISLTYYEDDDVLADHRDNVIEDQDMVVGVENLSKFGHGSGDPNVVYVRNDFLQQDMEILHSDGNFAEEVHGFKHSDEPSRRRLKWDE